MLEGKDPETLELIQKINTLQKRLILKQEEIIEKDLKLEEVEKVNTTPPPPPGCCGVKVFNHDNFSAVFLFSKKCARHFYLKF